MCKYFSFVQRYRQARESLKMSLWGNKAWNNHFPGIAEASLNVSFLAITCIFWLQSLKHTCERCTFLRHVVWETMTQLRELHNQTGGHTLFTDTKFKKRLDETFIYILAQNILIQTCSMSHVYFQKLSMSWFFPPSNSQTFWFHGLMGI